jgi:Na+/glutamate symporter
MTVGMPLLHKALLPTPLQGGGSGCTQFPTVHQWQQKQQQEQQQQQQRRQKEQEQKQKQIQQHVKQQRSSNDASLAACVTITMLLFGFLAHGLLGLPHYWLSLLSAAVIVPLLLLLDTQAMKWWANTTMCVCCFTLSSTFFYFPLGAGCWVLGAVLCS